MNPGSASSSNSATGPTRKDRGPIASQIISYDCEEGLTFTLSRPVMFVDNESRDVMRRDQDVALLAVEDRMQTTGARAD
ncbi:hypothetical protein DID88_004346 [Monilinia fructigena]|uniref:Uncharacterized protein n=1 Tax=Monilinia fructigena TaxID=38457 RepID=A0A395IY53_9HELO|nr:hypothetical protein DID88_004346 [Monilinia fructigena]